MTDLLTLKKELDRRRRQVDRYRQWVSDLQSGMYVNCIYCGHRYPPGTPGDRARILFEHIQQCPAHPLSKAMDILRRIGAWVSVGTYSPDACEELREAYKDLLDFISQDRSVSDRELFAAVLKPFDAELIAVKCPRCYQADLVHSDEKQQAFACGTTRVLAVGEGVYESKTCLKNQLIRLRDGCIKSSYEVVQTLAQALGTYPKFADDPKNFPDVDLDSPQVCTAEHVPETIAAEVANVIRSLREENKQLRTQIVKGQGDDGSQTFVHHKVNSQRLTKLNIACQSPTPETGKGTVLYKHCIYFNDVYRMLIQVVTSLEPHIEPAWVQGVLYDSDDCELGSTLPSNHIDGEYTVVHDGIRFTVVVESSGPDECGYYDCEGRCPHCDSIRRGKRNPSDTFEDGVAHTYVCEDCGVLYEEFEKSAYANSTILSWRVVVLMDRDNRDLKLYLEHDAGRNDFCAQINPERAFVFGAREDAQRQLTHMLESGEVEEGWLTPAPHRSQGDI